MQQNNQNNILPLVRDLLAKLRNLGDSFEDRYTLTLALRKLDHELSRIKYDASRKHQLIPMCDVCERVAAYQRATQFAGEHFFCEEHAMAEPDFMNNDDDSSFWSQIQTQEQQGE